jgi:predicted deacetylase
MPFYIIRLDDACPQMHLAKWQRVENILDKYNIQPLVAVIPNNKEKSLYYDKDENFWIKTIPRWQQKKWELALHGYEHIYTSTNIKSLVPFKQKSEFTGFSYEVQVNKIKTGLAILQSNNINPKVFIAPGHAFDSNTISALLKETNIKFLSDGISTMPFKKLNINWIPQQLWSFKKMPFGIWTICLHPNTMTEKDFNKMDQWLGENNKNVIATNSLFNKQFAKKTIVDILFEKLFWLLLKFKK